MYTEDQLRQAIKYACECQKFADYQMAGNLLINDVPNVEDCLNNLCDLDKNVANEITIN